MLNPVPEKEADPGYSLYFALVTPFALFSFLLSNGHLDLRCGVCVAVFSCFDELAEMASLRMPDD